MSFPTDLTDIIVGQSLAAIRHGFLHNEIEKMLVGPAIINVKGYGAKGDGTTDDTAAIIACIIALATSGGFIYFPPGTYLVTSSLTINPPSGKSVSLVGAGLNAATLKWGGGSAPTSAIIDMIALSAPANNTGGRIEGLTFDGQGNIQDCLRLTDVGQVDVRDCMFGGATRAGVKGLLGAVGSGTILSGVYHCQFGQPGHVAYGVHFSDCHHITIERNEFYDTTTASAYFQRGDGNRIINNDFEGMTLNNTDSIFLQNATNLAIAFNRFEDVHAGISGSRAIYFGTADGRGVDTGNPSVGVTVLGNEFGLAGAPQYHLEFRGNAQEVQLVANRFVNPGSLANSYVSVYASYDIIDVANSHNTATPWGGNYTGAVSMVQTGTLTGFVPFFAPGYVFSVDITGKLTWLIDTNLYRSAANVLKTDDQFIAVDGVATKTKAGTPTDGDFATTPPDGTIVVDSTASKIWVRVGGTWKGVVVA